MEVTTLILWARLSSFASSVATSSPAFVVASEVSLSHLIAEHLVKLAPSDYTIRSSAGRAFCFRRRAAPTLPGNLATRAPSEWDDGGLIARWGEGPFSWGGRGDFGSADLGLDFGQVEVDHRRQVQRDQLGEEQATHDAQAQGTAGFASGSLAHRDG